MRTSTYVHGRAPAQIATRVADQLAQTLRLYGIERVFGIPGGTISPVIDALAAAGIELVICQHESTAVYAAAGYAGATGRPGVVAVTSGPGALNALTGLAAADLGELPVLVLSGEASSHNFGRGALQEGSAFGLDLMAITRPITKFCELVVRPQRVCTVVAQALRVIAQQPHGAAFVSLPIDITSASTIPTDVPFAGPQGRARPDPGTCRQIAQLIDTAHLPAIMLGVGARRAGIGPIVMEIAQTHGIPVLTDIEAKGVFPESHPLALGVFGVGGNGQARDYLAQPVDLLLTLGCRFDDTTTANYDELLRPPAGTLIQIDHDPTRIGRSYTPDLAVLGDMSEALEIIRDGLTRPPTKKPGMGRLSPVQSIDVHKAAPHDPRLLPPLLRKVFGSDAIFCCDIGNHMLFSAQNLKVDQPDGFWVSLGLGGMGSGIGTAIGLQLALGRRRQVVCICGDGGMLMSGNELATCVRYGIPLVTIVFNDQHLGMVQQGFRATFGRAPDLSCPRVDFTGFGRALGLQTAHLERLLDLETFVDRHQGQPVLIEVPVDPSVRPKNPRIDVLSSDIN